jgi:hypothetical protein
LARAKQTNRAEARRRYRQTLAQTTAEAENGDDSEATTAPAAGAARPAPAGAQGRPSIGSAFRQAYHQAHYREDLRALPGLLTLGRPAKIPLTQTVIGVPWFLVSALLVIVGFAAFALDPTSGGLLFQLLALPPGGPTLPVLLVGFMATRASYMQGFLIGLLDLVLIGVYVTVLPSAVPQTGAGAGDVLVTAAITGLPTSILFAGAAAWYRRFLTLSSPRRPQPAKGPARGRSSGRPATRR